jgi:hypothetical protein
MKPGSKLTIQLNDDGSIKINGTGLVGSDAELKADMEELARELGGELVVEKHISKQHQHHDNKDTVKAR